MYCTDKWPGLKRLLTTHLNSVNKINTNNKYQLSVKSCAVLSKCSILSSNPKLSINWDRLTCFPSEGNSLCNSHSTDWAQDLHLSTSLCSWVRSFYEKKQSKERKTSRTSSFGNTLLRSRCLPFFYTSWPSLIFARFLISPSLLFLALHIAEASLFVQAQLCDVNSVFAPSCHSDGHQSRSLCRRSHGLPAVRSVVDCHLQFWGV